jgi:hypothetical protein
MERQRASSSSQDRNKNGRIGRPRKPDRERLGIQIALRLDSDLATRLDLHVLRLQRKNPGVVWSRASAIRALLLMSLATVEHDDAYVAAPEPTAPDLPVPEHGGPNGNGNGNGSLPPS